MISETPRKINTEEKNNKRINNLRNQKQTQKCQNKKLVTNLILILTQQLILLF